MIKLANITSTYRAGIIAKTYQKWIGQDCKILDIGCGTGVVAERLAKILKAKVYGCDIENYLLKDIKFKQMKSFDTLPYKNMEFDFCMFNDVLHHTTWENQEKLINEAARVAKSIAIFELIPGKINSIGDYILNKIHNPNMEVPYTYRSPQNWNLLFKKNKFNVRVQSVKRPFFYPFSHIGFLLAK